MKYLSFPHGRPMSAAASEKLSLSEDADRHFGFRCCNCSIIVIVLCYFQPSSNNFRCIVSWDNQVQRNLSAGLISGSPGSTTLMCDVDEPFFYSEQNRTKLAKLAIQVGGGNHYLDNENDIQCKFCILRWYFEVGQDKSAAMIKNGDKQSKTSIIFWWPLWNWWLSRTTLLMIITLVH